MGLGLEFGTLDSETLQQERSIEGLHARVSQTLRGRPLSVAGLALDLKWNCIEGMLSQSAEVGLMGANIFA